MKIYYLLIKHLKGTCYFLLFHFLHETYERVNSCKNAHSIPPIIVLSFPWKPLNNCQNPFCDKLVSNPFLKVKISCNHVVFFSLPLFLSLILSVLIRVMSSYLFPQFICFQLCMWTLINIWCKNK